MGNAHYVPYGEQLVMGSWRRRHQGQAEIRRAYAPHYELAIGKRSADLSGENTFCRDSQNNDVNGFEFFAAITVRRKVTDVMGSRTDARQS